jgi:hypothetical protein
MHAGYYVLSVTPKPSGNQFAEVTALQLMTASGRESKHEGKVIVLTHGHFLVTASHAVKVNREITFPGCDELGQVVTCT